MSKRSKRAQPEESVDQIINIAFGEGVHPARGLELILDNHGMCRAITTFGMYAVKNGRAECLSLLVRRLHAEVVERLSNAIESQEGSRPTATSIADLIAERDWLFGEYDLLRRHLTSDVGVGILAGGYRSRHAGAFA